MTFLLAARVFRHNINLIKSLQMDAKYQHSNIDLYIMRCASFLSSLTTCLQLCKSEAKISSLLTFLYQHCRRSYAVFIIICWDIQLCQSFLYLARSDLFKSMYPFRLIRPDISAQGDDKVVAEQECPSSQEPSASNGEADGSIVEEVSSRLMGARVAWVSAGRRQGRAHWQRGFCEMSKFHCRTRWLGNYWCTNLLRYILGIRMQRASADSI